MHLFVALISNISSYYNYAILTLAASFFSQEFLPPASKEQALTSFFFLLSFTVLVRPIASMIFGMIGDLYGRTVAIKITGFTGTAAILMLCLCPSFSAVGYLAVLIMLISRILVLANIAAEPDGMRIYITEHLSTKRTNFGNSIVTTTGQFGVLLAAVAIFLCNKYNISIRFTLVLAAILNLISVFTRSSLIETKEFKATSKLFLLSNFIRSNLAICITCVLINGAIGGIYNFYIIFLRNYAQELINFNAANIATIGIAVYALSAPLAGYLADRFNPIWQILVSILLMLCAAFITIWQISLGFALPASLIIIQIACIAFFAVPLQIYFKAYVPVNLRYRVLSTCHSIASVLISTPSLLIANYLWTKNKVFCFTYPCCLMIVLFLCAIFLQNISKNIK